MNILSSIGNKHLLFWKEFKNNLMVKTKGLKLRHNFDWTGNWSGRRICTPACVPRRRGRWGGQGTLGCRGRRGRPYPACVPRQQGRGGWGTRGCRGWRGRPYSAHVPRFVYPRRHSRMNMKKVRKLKNWKLKVLKNTKKILKFKGSVQVPGYTRVPRYMSWTFSFLCTPAPLCTPARLPQPGWTRTTLCTPAGWRRAPQYECLFYTVPKITPQKRTERQINRITAILLCHNKPNSLTCLARLGKWRGIWAKSN